MAGILERLIGTQGRAVVNRSDLKPMELEAAREILAEVFGVRLSEVDKMIQNRFQAVDVVSKEDELWPQELWVEG